MALRCLATSSQSRAAPGATLRTDTVSFSNLDANRITKYRKYQNTLEGDYQFNARYSIHFGYRYGSRRIEEGFEGFNLGSNGSLTPPPVRTLKHRSRAKPHSCILWRVQGAAGKELDHLLRRRARYGGQRIHAYRKLRLHEYSSQEQVCTEQEALFQSRGHHEEQLLILRR